MSRKAEWTKRVVAAGRQLMEALAQAPNATPEQVAIFQARQAAGLDPWPPYEAGWMIAQPWPRTESLPPTLYFQP